MTEVDVLVVIDNKRTNKRKFYATGNLRDEYLSGIIQRPGVLECNLKTQNGSTESARSASKTPVVQPLEKTPSPSNLGSKSNRISEIVGRSRRSLAMIPTNIPDCVSDVLSNKGVPVLLSQEKEPQSEK